MPLPRLKFRQCMRPRIRLNPTPYHRPEQGDSKSQLEPIRADKCPPWTAPLPKLAHSCAWRAARSPELPLQLSGPPIPHASRPFFISGINRDSPAGRASWVRWECLANAVQLRAIVSLPLSLHWPGRRAGCHGPQTIRVFLKDAGTRRLRSSAEIIAPCQKYVVVRIDMRASSGR